MLRVTIKNKNAHVIRVFSVVLLLSIVAGVLIELAQYSFAREPDTSDVLRDVLGALIGMLWFLWPYQNNKNTHNERRRVQAVLIVLVGFGTILQLAEISAIVLDEWRMANVFPVIADFETSNELQRWSGSVALSQLKDRQENGKFSLKVNTGTEKYSGISLNYFVADWRDYKQLLMAIYNNESESFSITLRINDMQHRQGEQLYSDRFNRKIVLLPGWNQIVVSLKDIENAPETRKLNLAEIEHLGIFTTMEKTKRTFYLDNMRLQ